MTSLLANLDENIKTKNQEDKDTRYLAICEQYIEADNFEQLPALTPYNSLQAWVIVNQNATLVFFLNSTMQLGFFGNIDNTSYSEGDGCEKVLSLDEYIDKELKKPKKPHEYNYLNRTIKTFLDLNKNPKESKRGPEEGGWGKVAHGLFKEFKKRYIHKFIAHTYNEDYIKNIDKLYEFYELVYKEDYIEQYLSPGFFLYIDIKNNGVHFGILETKNGDKINWEFKKFKAQDLLNKYIYKYNSVDNIFEKFNTITGVENTENTENTGKIIFEEEKINQGKAALTLANNLKGIKNAGERETIKAAYCKILDDYQKEFEPKTMPYSSNLYKYETELINKLGDENIKHGDCINANHKEFFNQIHTFNQKYLEPIYIDTGKTFATMAVAIETFGFFSSEDNAYILLKDWKDSFDNESEAIEFARSKTKIRKETDKLFKDLVNTKIDDTLLKFLEKIVIAPPGPSIQHKINVNTETKLKTSLLDFFIKSIEKNIDKLLFNQLFFKWYPNEYFEKSEVFEKSNVDAPITLKFLINGTQFEWNNDEKLWIKDIGDFTFVAGTHMLKIYLDLIKKYSKKPLLIQVIKKSLNDYITNDQIDLKMGKSLIEEINVYCFVIKEINKIISGSQYNEKLQLETLITTLEEKIKKLEVDGSVLSTLLTQPTESDLYKHLTELNKLNTFLTSLEEIKAVISGLEWIDKVIQSLKTEIKIVSEEMKKIAEADREAAERKAQVERETRITEAETALAEAQLEKKNIQQQVLEAKKALEEAQLEEAQRLEAKKALEEAQRALEAKEKEAAEAAQRLKKEKEAAEAARRKEKEAAEAAQRLAEAAAEQGQTGEENLKLVLALK